MDLYTLDENFLPNGVVDEFISLIWTERYNDFGDFVLVVPDTPAFKALLPEGTFLQVPGAKDDIMQLITRNYKDRQITCVGKSLTDFLRYRMLRDRWQTTKDSWTLTGTAGDICGEIVTEMLLPGGAMDSGDVVPAGNLEVIPNLALGAMVSDGDTIRIAITYGNVFDALKSVCDLDDLGFRLYATNITDSGYDLYFTTYRGLDLTSGQTTNPVVLFDPNMDSFTDIEGLTSMEGYVTAAYAWATNMTAQDQIGSAFISGTTAFTGFKRRTLMVDATDVSKDDYTTSELVAILNKRARNALINNNYIRMFNGQLVPQKSFVYGVNYELGDIVELRDTTEFSEPARISEYIRNQDNTGETAYPTLSVLSS